MYFLGLEPHNACDSKAATPDDNTIVTQYEEKKNNQFNELPNDEMSQACKTNHTNHSNIFDGNGSAVMNGTGSFTIRK